MRCFAIFATRLAAGLLVLALSAALGRAAPPPSPLRIPGPLSPRNANYRLYARLDEATHRVIAHGTLHFRNLERQPADKLVFHLYQNAFKNHASIFIFEAGPELRGESMPEHGFGAIDVTTLKINGREGLPYARLDDTLLTVPLDTPLEPNATVEVEMAWTVQLPRAFARSGYFDSFHAVTQWFPKIGVFTCDQTCRFRAHPYHGNTEFFADYGVYDVEIDVPAATRVGATGVLTEETPKGDRRLFRYHAEDVHDFAFFTDPKFVEVLEHIEDAYGGIAVRLLSRPGYKPYSSRYLAGLRAALKLSEERLGIYPYSNLTVVIPPWQAHGAGGMEYPTLISSIGMPMPSGIHEMDDVTIHEFIHQYFYGLLGNDEVEEAWLDEGLTQTFTGWVLDRMFGRCSALDLPSLCLSTLDREWLYYRQSTRQVPVSSRAFTIPAQLYGAITYGHPTVAMRTLERYLGEERMVAGLRLYSERFRFRHPNKADFVAAISEGAREDLSWFFRQALDSTRVADYAVAGVSSKPHEFAIGLWDCPPRPPAGENSDDSESSELFDPVLRRARTELLLESQRAACNAKDTPNAKERPKPPGRYELLPERAKPKSPLFDNEVIVQRRGDFFFPVDIVAVFADGSSERTTWSLAEQQATPEVRIKTLRYPRSKTALVRADVDPEQKLLLDENRINNSRYSEPRRRPILRLFLTLVGALSTLLDLGGAI